MCVSATLTVGSTFAWRAETREEAVRGSEVFGALPPASMLPPAPVVVECRAFSSGGSAGSDWNLECSIAPCPPPHGCTPKETAGANGERLKACLCLAGGTPDPCCQVILHQVGGNWVPRRYGDCQHCPSGGVQCVLGWSPPSNPTSVWAYCTEE